MKQTILITGAGGYIGSNATYLFLQKDYNVIAVDNFSAGFREPLSILQNKYGATRLRIYAANLQDDLTAIFEKEKHIDAVVHFAASCEVNESMKNPQKYFLNNSFASENLLQTMLKFNIKRIVFSSTCAVYGEAADIPVDEKHDTNPTNPYGLSKRITEQTIEWYGKLESINYVILRYFNVFGASKDGLFGDSKKPSIHLIQNAVRGALGIEPFYMVCPNVSTTDGTPIRDYVDVVDLCEAHVLAVEHVLKNRSNEIINLGTGSGFSVREIVNMVMKLTGVQFPLQAGEVRKGEYATMIASTEKAEQILGWKAKRSLSDGISTLITWYTAYPKGWNK